MTYLIDTDWLADHLVGRQAAVALIDRLTPDGIAISILTYAEIYEGVSFGRNSRHAEGVLRGFLVGVPVLAFSRPVARRYAGISGTLRSQGILLPAPDMLIAATPVHHDLTLVTRNLRHYERIPDLTLYQEPATPA